MKTHIVLLSLWAAINVSSPAQQKVHFTSKRVITHDSGILPENFRVRQVAGMVPVDRTNKKVLMVTSSAHPDRWILPKGGVKSSEQPYQAAVRETWEEAGVKGEVNTKKLGQWSKRTINRKGKRDSQIVYFEMEVTKIFLHWPEKAIRKREWFSLEDAIKVCYHGYMKKALKKCSLANLSKLELTEDEDYQDIDAKSDDNVEFI